MISHREIAEWGDGQLLREASLGPDAWRNPAIWGFIKAELRARGYNPDVVIAEARERGRKERDSHSAMFMASLGSLVLGIGATAVSFLFSWALGLAYYGVAVGLILSGVFGMIHYGSELERHHDRD